MCYGWKKIDRPKKKSSSYVPGSVVVRRAKLSLGDHMVRNGDGRAVSSTTACHPSAGRFCIPKLTGRLTPHDARIRFDNSTTQHTFECVIINYFTHRVRFISFVCLFFARCVYSTCMRNLSICTHKKYPRRCHAARVVMPTRKYIVEAN